ncbi:MAG: ABC transporter permease [Muribaculaceae bacterium]|nr:ABC transporter permease [Muribaculaceae bacterium]MDE6197178.1 ABC transporter permease [Muribaculaceae bacterium]
MKPTLFTFENWREIGATLARNKTRTFLTAFGIFWGTAMLGMLWGGARGFEGIMRRNFSNIPSNLGAVSSDVRSISYKGFNKGSWYDLTAQDVKQIRRLAPYIELSSEINTISVKAAYGSHSKSGRGIGVETDYTKIMNPVLYEGRFINSSDNAASRKVVVIGRNVAPELFGTESPIGKYVCINGIYMKCIGVAGQSGEASIAGRIDDSFIMPASTLRRAFNRGNKVDFMVFTTKAGHKPTENFPVIRRIVSANHTIHPDDENAIYLSDMSEMFEMINSVFLGISLLALFVGASSLIAGIIGVGNIMWIIVKERTHEFGIRRAIGAKPSDITIQVLSESVVLTLVAGTAGVCFAAAVLAAADRISADPLLGYAGFEIPFSTAIGIIVIFFILGSAAGTLPAVKAMRIKPIEAIRDK